jgi:hypothetical protein
VLQAKPKWAFGDKGREGCPPGADVELALELRSVKAVKTIDPDHVGAVTKTIWRDGAAYHTPNDFAAVTVSWEGTLPDGTKFDEARPRPVCRTSPLLRVTASAAAVTASRLGAGGQGCGA